MRDIAIRVEQLSKKFHVGKRQGSYSTLRETITDAVLDPFRRFSNVLHGQPFTSETEREFWALRDIFFEIERGEVVGVIGRNGAGKSTLLKILTRITEPTKGKARLRGRVGCLLEVGTGFHPELTGRENIYLNGAILGMRKVQVDRSFDEIVAFAEIDQFIDTPAKHYSSGMYMRLAFSVAAHLESDILLVDEVLAVGDAQFQKKCLNKMQEVSKEGRTVLFVSHNMPAITGLCSRAILLEQGQKTQDGLPHQVVSHYLNYGSVTTAVREWPNEGTAPGGEFAQLCAARVRDKNGWIIDVIDVCEPFTVEMEYEVLRAGSVLLPYFGFWNEEDICLFLTLDQDPAWRRRLRPPGRYVSVVQIPGNLLADGKLFVSANLYTMDPWVEQFHAPGAVVVRIIDNLNGESARGDYPGGLKGVMRPLLRWNTQFTAKG